MQEDPVTPHTSSEGARRNWLFLSRSSRPVLLACPQPGEELMTSQLWQTGVPHSDPSFITQLHREYTPWLTSAGPLQILCNQSFLCIRCDCRPALRPLPPYQLTHFCHVSPSLIASALTPPKVASTFASSSSWPLCRSRSLPLRALLSRFSCPAENLLNLDPVAIQPAQQSLPGKP